MKKRTIAVIVAVLLCGLLIFDSTRSMAGTGKDADNKNENISESGKADNGSGDRDLLETVLGSVDGDLAGSDDKEADFEKDETVYIITGADGSAQKVIVSDWLKNNAKAARIEDVSNLEGIENVKGDEEFLENTNGKGSWNANGNDIYYQGSSDRELPVTMKISYFLDGKEISPAELAGKSGRVRIRFDYMNDQYETAQINGQDEKIYVPFAMMTGVILDDEVFSNVEVTNGRVINDGSRTVAIGLALPGLKENLALTDNKLEIPDYFELVADARDFRLETTMTVATNSLFNNLLSTGLNSDDNEGDINIDGSMEELTGAMAQLMDGADAVYEGLRALSDATGELSDGVGRIADGAAAVAGGASDVNNGAAQVADGAAQLAEGLATLNANSDALKDGAEQVFTTLLATAGEQLTAAGLAVPEMTVDNYAEVLNGVIASLDDTQVYAQALDAVTTAVEEKSGYITEQVTAAVQAEVENGVKAAVRAEVENKVSDAVKAQVEAKVTAAVKAEVSAKAEAAVRDGVKAQVIAAAAGMDAESYAKALEAGLIDAESAAAIEAATDAKMASDELKAMVSGKLDEQMNSDEIQALIAVKTDEQMKSDEAASIISANIEEQMASEQVAATIEKLTAAKMAEEEIQTMILNNVEEQKQKAISENMAGEEVQTKLAAASAGAQKVIALKASLDSYNAFYLGIGSYTDGVAQAAAGAAGLKEGSKKLADGTATLAAGAKALSEGADTLSGRMPEFKSGVDRLRDGAGDLSDGLKAFNEQAVEKLVDLINGDLKGVADRLKATATVSGNYKNYSGIADDMDGEVKFIYRSEAIK